ncbi:MAG: hypothetical protein AAF515_07500 [Pseudomonadota bacterium]
MSKFTTVLGWVGIVLLGLAHGFLEDLMFLRVLVEHMPASWDLTGNLFFTFTVPLSQLLVLLITGTFAWFVLRLHQLPRLIAFWACWTVSRAAFLTQFLNPVEDIAIYLAWILFWCALIGLLAYLRGKWLRGN